jgi:hypothetical protein
MMDQSRAKVGLPFGEHRTHIVIRERESYLVPIIAKAIEISEHLQVSDSGLRIKDIQGLTGFSLSTIYRILRTLLAFGYVWRDLGGYYRLTRFAPLKKTASTSPPERL